MRKRSEAACQKIGTFPTSKKSNSIDYIFLSEEEISYGIENSLGIPCMFSFPKNLINIFFLSLLVFLAERLRSFKTVQLHFPLHQSHKLTHFWQLSSLLSSSLLKKMNTEMKKMAFHVKNVELKCIFCRSVYLFIRVLLFSQLLSRQIFIDTPRFSWEKALTVLHLLNKKV